MSKSKLFGCEIDLVARGINCSIDSLSFTYLGLPIGASMSRAKTSTLFFGGRLILYNYVLGNLGKFFFSLYRAPSKVIECLEKIRMRFF
uniref:Uncharacterized protein n=1 Tax=Lactuca sativa TaxID=4236 RepID=A0A9R1UCW9_LACSA|nr:hypothetical protein LSAT_V11C900471140 [Lactuca sativa]